MRFIGLTPQKKRPWQVNALLLPNGEIEVYNFPLELPDVPKPPQPDHNGNIPHWYKQRYDSELANYNRIQDALKKYDLLLPNFVFEAEFRPLNGLDISYRGCGVYANVEDIHTGIKYKMKGDDLVNMFHLAFSAAHPRFITTPQGIRGVFTWGRFNKQYMPMPFQQYDFLDNVDTAFEKTKVGLP